MSSGRARDVARSGLAAAHTALPHRATLQPLFGDYDLSGIRAAVGGSAERSGRSLGASAFAQGERIGFQRTPDLFTAAHEAAHVIQQRSGRVPASHQGSPGDALERHADSVASLVASGQSAVPALDRMTRGAGRLPALGSQSGAVQLKVAPEQENEEIPVGEKYRDQMRNYRINNVGQALSLVSAEVENRTQFETALGRLIVDNLSLFSGAILKVNDYVSRYLDGVIAQFSAQYPELAAVASEFKAKLALRTREYDQASAQLSSTSDAKQREELTQLLQAALKGIRDVQYEVNEKVLTGKKTGTEEAYQALTKQLTGSTKDKVKTPDEFRLDIPGIAPIPQEPSREDGKMPLYPEWQKAAAPRVDRAFARRSRSDSPLAKKGRKPDTPGEQLHHVWFAQPVDPKKEEVTAKDLDHSRPNMFGWNQIFWYMMPIYAGISGTMSDMLLLAMNAGLSQDELKDYAMVQLGVMLKEHHHSFHEVVSVLAANKVVPYRPGYYLAPISDKIRKLPGFLKLVQAFPHLFGLPPGLTIDAISHLIETKPPQS